MGLRHGGSETNGADPFGGHIEEAHAHAASGWPLGPNGQRTQVTLAGWRARSNGSGSDFGPTTVWTLPFLFIYFLFSFFYWNLKILNSLLSLSSEFKLNSKSRIDEKLLFYYCISLFILFAHYLVQICNTHTYVATKSGGEVKSKVTSKKEILFS